MKRNHVISAYLYSKKDWNAGSIRGEYLTHLNYSFALIKDGVISGAELDKLDEIRVVKKRYPHLKVLISVGGWGADGFSDAASASEARTLFARSADEFMKTYDFDGIDIDWEYPCSSDAGIKSRPEDRENFNLLLQELRTQIDRRGEKDGRKYLLTAALGGTQYTLQFYDLKTISGILDYINLMTYDFTHGFSAKTGHHTCLFGSKVNSDALSADKAVKICLNHGIPASRLVLGCAFYGRGWDVSDGSSNGLYASVASGCVSYSYRDLVSGFINMNGYRRYWDDDAKAPYLWNGKHFITYDDPESLVHKSAYIKSHGLGGAMFWEYSQDYNNELLKTLYLYLK